MKMIIHLILVSLTVSLNACSTPIQNAKTQTFKVRGNCEMCQKTIQAAAFKKGEAKAEWNTDTKIATVTFDSIKTSAEVILKRIAYAGYDNVSYLAPDDAYAKLPECCQYERKDKKEVVQEKPVVTEKASGEEQGTYTCPMHPEIKSDKPGKCPKCGMALVKKTQAVKTEASVQSPNPNASVMQSGKDVLSKVYDSYFGVKDALIKGDSKSASQKAKDLLKAIEAAPMNAMQTEQHSVWMKVLDGLKFDAAHISEAKEVEIQRGHFASLSKNMHEVIKVFKADETIYYQHCPMYNDNKGANWLSKESGVKNPYYGSQMLTCGKTIETIK